MAYAADLFVACAVKMIAVGLFCSHLLFFAKDWNNEASGKGMETRVSKWISTKPDHKKKRAKWGWKRVKL